MNALTGRENPFAQVGYRARVLGKPDFWRIAILGCIALMAAACDRHAKQGDTGTEGTTDTAAADESAGALAAAASFYDDRHGVLYEAGFGSDCKLTGYLAESPSVAGDKPVLRIFPSRTISPIRTQYNIEISPSFLPRSSALLTEEQGREWVTILDKAAAAAIPSGHSISTADVRGTLAGLYFTVNVGSPDVSLKFVNSQGFFGMANAGDLKQALVAALKDLTDFKATKSSMTW